MKTFVLMLAWCTAITAAAQPQFHVCPPDVPQTRLERFRATRYSLLVSGQSHAIQVNGVQSQLAIVPMEICDVATKERCFGLLVRISSQDGGDHWDSFLDYDEIEAVIAGLDGMGHIPPGLVRLTPGEAIVSTLTLVVSLNVRENSIHVQSPAGAIRFTRGQSGELRKAFPTRRACWIAPVCRLDGDHPGPRASLPRRGVSRGAARGSRIDRSPQPRARKNVT